MKAVISFYFRPEKEDINIGELNIKSVKWSDLGHISLDYSKKKKKSKMLKI